MNQPDTQSFVPENDIDDEDDDEPGCRPRRPRIRRTREIVRRVDRDRRFVREEHA